MRARIPRLTGGEAPTNGVETGDQDRRGVLPRWDIRLMGDHSAQARHLIP